MKIAKQFDFHASHYLPNHDGVCRRLHGHTYMLEVMIMGPRKGPTGDSDEGMLLDFYYVKDIYDRCIEPKVEHRFLNETLKGEIEIPLTTAGHALTTCEVMAEWALGVFMRELRELNIGRLTEVTTRLWETRTSYAEAGPWPINT